VIFTLRSWNRLFVGILCLFTMLFAPVVARAQPVDTVLDVDFSILDLGTPSLLSGTALAQGAVYRYNNVATIGGVTVRAEVTISQLNGCTLGTIDANVNAPRF